MNKYKELVNMIERENYKIVKSTSYEGFVLTEYQVYDDGKFIVSLNGNGFDGFTEDNIKHAYDMIRSYTSKKHMDTPEAFEAWVKERVNG